jgi:hypothetical protein
MEPRVTPGGSLHSPCCPAVTLFFCSPVLAAIMEYFLGPSNESLSCSVLVGCVPCPGRSQRKLKNLVASLKWCRLDSLLVQHTNLPSPLCQSGKRQEVQSSIPPMCQPHLATTCNAPFFDNALFIKWHTKRKCTGCALMFTTGCI